MAAIDDLIASDTLLITGRISYLRHIPSAGFPDKTISVAGVCLSKKRGELAFTITSDQLRLPITGLAISFVGTVDASGTIVTWTADQPLGFWFDVWYLTRLHGQLVTALSASASATIGKSCTGEERVFKADVKSVVANSALFVEILTFSDHLSATEISMEVSPGQMTVPVAFDTDILSAQFRTNNCGHRYLEQPGFVSLTAVVSNIVTDGTVESVSYLWGDPVGPARITGSKEQQSVLVILDGSGEITISVQVTVATSTGGGAATATLRCSVLDATEVAQGNIICELRRQVLQSAISIAGIGAGFTADGKRFVDRLFDPAPDMARTPRSARAYSREDLQVMRSAIAALTTAAEKALGQAEKTLDRAASRWGEGGPVASQDP